MMNDSERLVGRTPSQVVFEEGEGILRLFYPEGDEIKIQAVAFASANGSGEVTTSLEVSYFVD